MLGTVSGVSAGTWISGPAFSVAQRGEKVFMKATKSARCWSVKVIQEGILVLLKPRTSERYRSSSVGRVPVGVERHLNVAATKLRGRIFRYGPFSPPPSPRKPWQPQQ